MKGKVAWDDFFHYSLHVECRIRFRQLTFALVFLGIHSPWLYKKIRKGHEKNHRTQSAGTAVWMGSLLFNINRFLWVFSVELRNGKQSNKKMEYARAAENKNDNDKRATKTWCKQHWIFFKPHCQKIELKKYMKESPTNLERTWSKRKQFAEQAPKLLIALLVDYIIGIYGTVPALKPLR